MNTNRRRSDSAFGSLDEIDQTKPESLSPLEEKYRALLNRHLQRTQELAVVTKERDDLFKEVYFDDLTGLPNRKLLRKSFEDAVKSGLPIVILVIDLDKFKPINDTYGHNVGDDALKLVADTINSLASLTRKTDIISIVPSRTGGDEFVVVFEGANLEELESKIKQIKVAFTTQKLILGEKHGNVEIPVGASFGAYERKKGESLEHCIEMADEEMYKDKEKKQSKNTIAPYSWHHNGYLQMPSAIPTATSYIPPSFGIK